MSKFDGAMSSTDTCPTTQSFHHLYKDELGVYEGYCWNHIRDVWAGGVHKGISAWAKNKLENDLKKIPSIWRVSSDVKEIIHSLHKEFSLTANYPKGHGQLFREFFLEKHAGEYLFQTERTAGSRQDIVAMGSLALYWNRNVYLEFLADRMRWYSNGEKNILQSCLWMELTLLEVAASARLFSIFYLSLIVPVRWFAAKTHKLSHRIVKGYPWGVRSMGIVADIIFEKYHMIRDDPKLIIDEKFMMSMFDTLENDIPEFKKYNEYLYKKRKSSFATRTGAKFVSYQLLRKELFDPSDDDNKETTKVMADLGKITADCTKKVVEQVFFKLCNQKSYQVFLT